MTDLATERIHPASAGVRRRASEQGRFARSYDLSSSLLLLGGIAGLLYFGPEMAEAFGELAGRQWGGGAWLHADANFAAEQGWNILGWLGAVAGPILGLLLLVAVAANMLQSGFRFLPGKLTPDLDRINPMTGAGRLLSWDSVFRLLFGLFKIAVVLGVAGWSLWPRRSWD